MAGIPAIGPGFPSVVLLNPYRFLPMQKRIDKNDIFAATEGGKAVILHYFPHAAPCFNNGGSRNFRVRSDDRNPSATVFLKDGIWFFQDKGGPDNKAYTAIQLVMREQSLTFPQAVEWIASKFAPTLLEDRTRTAPGAPAPAISPADPQDAISVVRRETPMTDAELALLGYKITQQCCDDLCLVPLKGYITRKNAKGKSYYIQATENYPIFYYDYGSWGKIYQPLGETRFLYVGAKPENFIFGEKAFRQRYSEAEKGLYPGMEDDEEGYTEDERWNELIICSGPSDALNVHAAGYRVCWLNSETADLKAVEWTMLSKLAKNVYILYDIDDTGLDAMYRIALRYLELRVIRLPDDLKNFRTRKGGQSKDAKDFFMYYRKPEQPDPHRLFSDLLKVSGSLQFWTRKVSATGKFSGYEVNNVQLYGFLRASGFFALESPDTPKGFTFCRVKDNVIHPIPDGMISKTCLAHLKDYLLTHTSYYRQDLINYLMKTNQLKVSSLENMDMLHPDTKDYDEKADYFFFRNTAVKVTASGADKVNPASLHCMVFDEKVIKRDISLKKPFFDIEYTPEYADALTRLRKAAPHTPEYVAAQLEIDAMNDSEKWSLKIFRNNLSFMKYVWNTGNRFWRKQESGERLSELEKQEVELHFMNKVMALGYMLCKHKSPSQPYAIYGMEMNIAEDGEHNGGTGKSIFVSSVGQLRSQVVIDGQQYKQDRSDFLLERVKVGITDSIFIDDLNESVDLHRFMPMVTGNMTVNKKYCPSISLPFAESPKVAFTSNHAIRQFDGSLRRRTWFVAFSDYYHAGDPLSGLKERTPFTEFGKNLIVDYDQDEMDDFYTFMFNCMSVFKKIRQRIQPPMEDIEKRNLQRDMGDSFLSWAEDYFDITVTNCFVERDRMMEAYKSSLSDAGGKSVSTISFTKKLKLFCLYKDWVYNPEELLKMGSQSDRELKRFRKKTDGKQVYFVYIDTLKDGRYYTQNFFDDPVFESVSDDSGTGDDLPFD